MLPMMDRLYIDVTSAMCHAVCVISGVPGLVPRAKKGVDHVNRSLHLLKSA